MPYTSHLKGRRATPPNLQAHPAEIANHAGGFSFTLTPLQQLRRFLILGTIGGTYYVSERDLTQENVEVILAEVKAGNVAVLQDVVAVSRQGLAPKNEPAILVLALILSYGTTSLKRAAVDCVQDVCRTGTHILHLAHYINHFRGWGRIARKALATWYRQPVEHLAYQVVKYQSRDGWTHKDVIRLAHIKPATETQQNLFHWIQTGDLVQPIPDVVTAFELCKTGTPAQAVVAVDRFRLTREMLPTPALADKAVQRALINAMPIHAAIRNLANLTKSGALDSDAHRAALLARLQDSMAIESGRVHPLAFYLAEKAYGAGTSRFGHGSWTPDQAILAALGNGFEIGLQFAQPWPGKVAIAIDLSGSMSADALGVEGLSCHEAAGALAFVMWKPKPSNLVIRFNEYADRFPTELCGQDRAHFQDALARLAGGGTDCAAPIKLAINNNWLDLDAFVILTDSETWAGSNGHPYEIWLEYRRRSGRPTKLVCIGMAANKLDLGIPDDPDCLKVCGFDLSAGQVIGEFLAGKL